MLSMHLWMDNWIEQKTQSFINTASQFYYQTDPSLGTGYMAFAAPFRSFVYDSGVNGAIIFNSISGYFFNALPYTSSGSGNLYSGVVFPQIDATGGGYLPLELDFGTGAYVSLVSGYGVQSGNRIFFTDSIAQTGVVRVSGSGDGTYYDIPFTIDGTPIVISRGQFGMVTDFVNGRAIFPSNVISTNALLSGNYAFKGINVYLPNQWENRITFTNKYYLNSRFNRPITGIPPPYNYVSPCVFLSDVDVQNQNWAFGGVYNTTFTVTVNVLAENLSQLEGVMSTLVDAKYATFPQLNTNVWPLGPLGDYKSGYNYQTLLAQYGSPGNLYTITDVRASKLSDAVKTDESLFLGIVDLTVEKPRSIH